MEFEGSLITVQEGWGFDRNEVYCKSGEFHFNAHREFVETKPGYEYNNNREYVELRTEGLAVFDCPVDECEPARTTF